MLGLRLSPSRTLVTSFNPKTTTGSQYQASQSGEDTYFEEGDWVLCVTSSSSSNGGASWVGCALSNGEIQVYDQAKLHPLQTYRHKGLVTDLVQDVSDQNALIASAADGTVTIFDIRQANNPAFEVMMPRSEEALSVSMGFDGKVAAVGTHKAKIHFFDIRGGQSILGTFNQAHTDEITRVRFQTLKGSFGATTTTTPLLVSAAEDGLACVFDTSQPSEEAAIQNILTVQSPIREIGFFGPQSEALYCLTGSESLLLYHKDDAVCRKDYGLNTRLLLNHQMNAAFPQNNASIVPIDYLVDCHWDSTLQELQLLAGSANGDAGVFRVEEQGLMFKHRLEGGHRGVIRAWNTLSSNTFLTVGEDARLCEWNRMSFPSSAGVPKAPEVIVSQTASNNKRWNSGPLARAGGGKMRRARSRMAASPY